MIDQGTDTTADDGARPARSGASTEPKSAAAKAGGAGPLDSTQSYCCPPPLTRDDVRRQRWEARAILWRASLLKSVRCCGAQPRTEKLPDGSIHGRKHVTVRRYGDVAGIGGLMACGSVWSCPRCSALVAFERAGEMARVFERCREYGGRAYLLTLTLRHVREDRLSDLWELLSAGWRSAFGSRGWTGARATSRRAARVGDRERFGVAGLVRVVECTVSRPGSGSGWHLHAHVVVFCSASLREGLAEGWQDALARMGVASMTDGDWLARQMFLSRVVSRWSAGVQRAGGSPVLGAACDVRSVDLVDDEFLSLYLAKSTYSAALEVTAGQPVKIARGERLAPFQVLAELVASGPSFGVRTPKTWSIERLDGAFAVVDHRSGEIERISSPGVWRLWHEWEIASRGRRQIMWSRLTGNGIRPLTFWDALIEARGEQSDDEAIARRGAYGEFVGEIPIDLWRGRLVWRPGEIVALLAAANDSSEAIRRLVQELESSESDL